MSENNMQSLSQRHTYKESRPTFGHFRVVT